jgi:transposase
MPAMTKKAGTPEPVRARRREFTEEFRREAVQMMLDGHTAASVAGRLGLSGTNLLYRWKREQLERTGPVATSLEARVRELEVELHRAERERDILKKALAIFGRHE